MRSPRRRHVLFAFDLLLAAVISATDLILFILLYTDHLFLEGLDPLIEIVLLIFEFGNFSHILLLFDLALIRQMNSLGQPVLECFVHALGVHHILNEDWTGECLRRVIALRDVDLVLLLDQAECVVKRLFSCELGGTLAAARLIRLQILNAIYEA